MTSGRIGRYAATVLMLTGMTAWPAVQAQSAPSVSGVSGTLQAGATLTITGGGFGTKANPAPLKWDNFDSGTNGAVIGNGWSYTTGCNPGPCHPPIYSNAVTRPGSSLSIRANFDDGGRTDCPDGEGCNWSSSYGVTGGSSTNRITGLTLPVIYLDTWVNYAPATPEPRNVKLIRVHTNTYAPNLYLNIYCLTDTDGARLGQDGGGTNVTFPSSPWRGSSFYKGNWRHIQMYLVESTPGVADGTAIITIDNVTSVNRVGNFMTRTDASQHWDTVWIGNYAGHNALYSCLASPGNTYIYWDDSYIDITRAHVEIGDADTYAACTHREIQVPSAWTSTSISVKANAGSFPNLSNLYLYVMDSTGAVNASGYKLAGGSSSDLVSPAPIRDLHPTTTP
jgi:hypothetical protein